jgi:orotate phosphoribosyltransferase
MAERLAATMDLRDIVTMTEILPAETIAAEIVLGGLLHIRDVAGGEEPFHYSSGNFGDKYVSVKGGCSDQELSKLLARQLTLRLKDIYDFDFVAGLVTGGVPPSIYLRDWIQEFQDREIPWVYIRDTRKLGGTKETVTGLYMPSGERSSFIPIGAVGLVIEELTNFANSITNGAILLRSDECQCGCRLGATILDYGNPKALEYRTEHQLELINLVSMSEVLDAAQRLGLYSERLIDEAHQQLRDPLGWMARYGLEKQEHRKG